MGECKDLVDGITWLKENGHNADLIPHNLITDIGKLQRENGVDLVSAQLMDWKEKGLYPQIRASRVSEPGSWKCYLSISVTVPLVEGYGSTPLEAIMDARKIIEMRSTRVVNKIKKNTV